MIDMREHIYDDDPRKGHADVKTKLEGVNYFFLGNGHIQAAVQWAQGDEGTPLGLLVMNPETLSKKRESYTMDPDIGLAGSQIIITDQTTYKDLEMSNLRVEWSDELNIPVVVAQYDAGDIFVTETFYCVDGKTPRLARIITLENQNDEACIVSVHIKLNGKTVEKRFHLTPFWEDTFFIEYFLDRSRNLLSIAAPRKIQPDPDWMKYWRSIEPLNSGVMMIDNYYQYASWQLYGMISERGLIDASIWQYNREWVRDHSFMTLGLINAGHLAKAKIMLERLMDKFISEDGDAIDSSERRDASEVELDQNGLLLYTLRVYAEKCSDWRFIRRWWEKIIKLAEYPLRPEFRKPPSGLLFNCRDYWERHRAHGIKPGCELAYQVFVSVGLEAASAMAEHLSEAQSALKWRTASRLIKNSTLRHPVFALLGKDGFIKRRGLTGAKQDKINPPNPDVLPDGIPLKSKIKHHLNPDSSAVMAILYGFIDQQCPLAQQTIEQMEILWNQEWTMGGYGRYNASSEADAPGPWPIVSLYIARAYLKMGKLDKVYRVIEWLQKIDGGVSGAWFEVYCDRISPPAPQVGILPWAWAEMIMLCKEYRDRMFPALPEK